MLWWEYMSHFDKSICLDKKDVADCSYTVMKDKQIPESTIAVIKQKIEETYKNVTDNKKNILKQSFE